MFHVHTLANQFPHQVLVDGQVELPTAALPDLWLLLDQWFNDRGIQPHQRLIYESANTVPHALVLLYLLDRNYSFLLLPESPDRSSDPSIWPAFCECHLTVAPLPTNYSFTGDTLQSLLVVTQNPNFKGVPTFLNDGASHLYMRTSGSTGTPKLVVHHQDKFCENIRQCQARLRLTPEDRVAIPVPLFHMYGLGAAFLPSLWAGASVDLQKGANLLRYLQREQTFNPTVAFLTPIFCEMLLKGRKSPRAYRFTVAAGDRVRSETFQAYETQFGPLVKLYGSTEMGVMAVASPEDTPVCREDSVGLPIDGVQMALEDSQTDVPDEWKGLGELWCSSDHGFVGYVTLAGDPVSRNGDVTVPALLPSAGNWFRTKDFGQISAAGRVTVVGRCDHSVNRDGLLVFFSDVERAIDTLAAVELSVVVAKGEGTRGKGLVAYCVPQRGANLTEADIRRHCFEHLPKRAIPDGIVVIKTLPLLPNGKVDRQALMKRDDLPVPVVA